MPETLGRGDFFDDARIEKDPKYATENGVATSSIISQTQSQVGKTMSNATSFAHQIELLTQLKNYLQTFQERLDSVSKSYQNQLANLHDAGLMDEIARDYSNEELAMTKQKINDLISHIEGNDIPKVDKIIRYLEQGL